VVVTGEAVRVARRVGLLGGTFDPPHVGHLVVAEVARVSLGLDEVRLLVAGRPWMKDTVTPARHRVAMAELAVADDDALVVDDRETRRDGPTYTADTLAELHAEEPGTAWWFLLGADAAAQLPAWHRAPDALRLATFVAVTRPGYRLEASHGLLSDVVRLEVPLVDVSSTELRRRVAAGEAVSHLVPPRVERYIREQGLYLPSS
jgi:nicotinate-nucleotide adenylyltransferase